VIIPARNPELAVPSNRVGDIPVELQEHVMAGNLASQYTTVERDGQQLPALVVGAPATTDNGSFGVYLIFLLAGFSFGGTSRTSGPPSVQRGSQVRVAPARRDPCIGARPHSRGKRVNKGFSKACLPPLRAPLP
jgi:hypothetical protein